MQSAIGHEGVSSPNQPQCEVRHNVPTLQPIDKREASRRAGGNTKWSNKNPFMASLTERYDLNGLNSTKETIHLSIDLTGSEIEYKAGDALGVIPTNPPELVDELISTLGWSPEETVTTQKGERDLRTALIEDVEVHRLNKKVMAAISSSHKPSPGRVVLVRRERRSLDSNMVTETWSRDDDGSMSALSSEDQDPLSRIASIGNDAEATEEYIWSRDYVDLVSEIGEYPGTPQDLVDTMDRLKPRLYSISSSPDAHLGEVHLTVAVVRYHHHDRDRMGLCSGWLADTVAKDTPDVPVFLSATKSFVLPADPTTDIIMVGPGTGIAPFRAFLEQRDCDGATGRNWLFFGDWTESDHYYYREQIEGWIESGLITQMTTAFSRDQEEKIYVQHRMMEHGSELWSWLSSGAVFYVCGDKSRMAKDVHQALIDIAKEHGGMTAEDAKHYIETKLMREEKRYLRDVY